MTRFDNPVNWKKNGEHCQTSVCQDLVSLKQTRRNSEHVEHCARDMSNRWLARTVLARLDGVGKIWWCWGRCWQDRLTLVRPSTELGLRARERGSNSEKHVSIRETYHRLSYNRRSFDVTCKRLMSVRDWTEQQNVAQGNEDKHTVESKIGSNVLSEKVPDAPITS